jgi:RNA polymerase sigma-70 factor, ECF subfamily
VNSPELTNELTAIVRRDGGRLLAVLTGLLKNLALAEDCLQDAYASALSHWTRGVPANPAAWLLQVARRKAIDRLRRASTAHAKQETLTELLQIEADAPEHEDNAIPDDRLKLIFTCCHPALDRNASVALTLRSLCGLTTDEIARAFLVTRETMAQRLVRAQQKIAKAGIAYEVPQPAQWPERMEAVLSVIYLIFNEGYASTTTDYIRVDLCEEAIRLARLVLQLAPEDTESAGLLSLMLFSRARFEARCDAEGVLVPLEHQDREFWDQGLIAEATTILQQVLRRRQAGPYQLQAAIAAIHSEAATYAEIDWHEIVMIYDRLLAITANPVVALNRLVALSQIKAPATVMPALESLAEELDNYQPFHAAMADLLYRTGEQQRSRQAYLKAIALSTTFAERKFLGRKLAQLPARNAPSSASEVEA